MTPVRQFDIAVIGGGPTGLLAALAAADRGRVVLVLDKLPARDASLRIDAIPMRTMALLSQFGIDAAALNAGEEIHGRWASWETDNAVWHDKVRTVHIERPQLEAALFGRVVARDVTVIVDRIRWTGVSAGAGWRADYLIDASGRRAITAPDRILPRCPWISRFFWAPRRGLRTTPEFRIAALPEGYAYRLGSALRIGIGFVGHGEMMKAPPENLEQILGRRRASWLLENMPPVASMTRGMSGIASIQWTEPSFVARAGDAALARDALSSQGLATSFSDALYAVAALENVELLNQRHRAARMAHIAMLDQLLAASRHRESPTFRSYRRFVQEHLVSELGHTQPKLEHGRLVCSG